MGTITRTLKIIYNIFTGLLLHILASLGEDHMSYSGVEARQNSEGVIGLRGAALFCHDFSLVRFFSSRKRNELPAKHESAIN